MVYSLVVFIDQHLVTFKIYGLYCFSRFWVMGDGDDDRRSVSSELSARVERQQSQRTSVSAYVFILNYK